MSTDAEEDSYETNASVRLAPQNPWVGSGIFSAFLPAQMRLRLDIYTVSGHLVRNVYDGSLTAGRHEVSWDGHDKAGRRVASGIYLAKLVPESGSTVTAKFAVLQ